MIHIMYGLPGSGKTYKAMELYKSLVESYSYDRIEYRSLDKEEDFQTISNKPVYGHRGSSTYILDGYFPTMKVLCDKLDTFFNNCYDYGDEIIIHNFIPNIENCLYNDSGRRDKNSVASIKKGMELFDEEYLRAYFKKVGRSFTKQYMTITVEDHDVLKYNNKMVGEYIYSDWLQVNDGLDFTQLDNYLEKNYPNTSFLQYKKLSKFIETEETREYDYYDEEGIQFIQYRIKYLDIISVLGDIK